MTSPMATAPAQPVYDVDKIRADFPILSRQVNGKPLVYLDLGGICAKAKPGD